MLKKLLKYKFLIAIVVLASILRFYNLTEVPPSLNWDEVSHGYNAYSILKTGRDEWGVFLPIIFRVFGDYKLPIYIYSTAFSVAMFGLNAFAVRFPSVLAGIATVILTYFLTYELIGKRKISKTVGEKEARTISLLASLLVTVEPWSFFLSRGAFEANMALMFIIAGVYLFLKGLDNGKLFIFSALSFGFSVWTYNSARIIVPVIIIFLTLLYKKPLKIFFDKDRKKIFLSSIVLLMFLIPMFWQLAGGAGQARYGKVSILDQGAIAEINDSRNNSDFKPFVARMIHNKVTYFVPRFLSNWTKHLSGEFLIFEGGDNYQFSVPGRGVIYSINVIFLLVGVFALLISTRKGNRSAAVILFWFFTGPIASSLTRETPHVLRSITTLPVPMILTAVGIVGTVNYLSKKLKLKKRKYLIWVYLLLLSFSVAKYMNDYFNIYPKKYSQSWQYGNKEMVEYIKDKYDDYHKIIVTKKYGEPHEFILFYWPWDPESYRNDPNLIRFEQSDWYWVDAFSKFYFVNDWQFTRDSVAAMDKPEGLIFNLESGGEVNCASSRCLIVTSPGNIPPGWDKLETIYFLDGTVAYEIYEN